MGLLHDVRLHSELSFADDLCLFECIVQTTKGLNSSKLASSGVLLTRRIKPQLSSLCRVMLCSMFRWQAPNVRCAKAIYVSALYQLCACAQ